MEKEITSDGLLSILKDVGFLGAENFNYEKYKFEEKTHESSIPELTKFWVEVGRNTLDEPYQEIWNNAVPVRLIDIYKGMELIAAIEIIKELNSGCDLELVKGILNNQKHSDTSRRLLCVMVKSLCNRGPEFYNYIKNA